MLRDAVGIGLLLACVALKLYVIGRAVLFELCKITTRLSRHGQQEL